MKKMKITEALREGPTEPVRVEVEESEVGEET